MEHHIVPHITGKLLALPLHIKLSWKRFATSKRFSLFWGVSIPKREGLIGLAPGKDPCHIWLKFLWQSHQTWHCFAPVAWLATLVRRVLNFFFWLKQVLDRGPEQRESKLTVLCPLIIIILISYIIIYYIIIKLWRTIPAGTGNGTPH